MKLEEKLVSLRKAKGLSQMQLAEMMNVSRQAISRWEGGAAVPATDNLKYLGRLYDVPLEYLLHDDAPDLTRLEDHGKDVKKVGRKRRLIFLAIIAIVLILLYVVFIGEKPKEPLKMTEMEGSEVETVNENEFGLER